MQTIAIIRLYTIDIGVYDFLHINNCKNVLGGTLIMFLFLILQKDLICLFESCNVSRETLHSVVNY